MSPFLKWCYFTKTECRTKLRLKQCMRLRICFLALISTRGCSGVKPNKRVRTRIILAEITFDASTGCHASQKKTSSIIVMWCSKNKKNRKFSFMWKKRGGINIGCKKCGNGDDGMEAVKVSEQAERAFLVLRLKIVCDWKLKKTQSLKKENPGYAAESRRWKRPAGKRSNVNRRRKGLKN